MATARTATLSLRRDPSFKEVLRVLAENEHRNIANMIETMIRDYCKRNGGSYDWSPCCPLGILGTIGFQYTGRQSINGKVACPPF